VGWVAFNLFSDSMTPTFSKFYNKPIKGKRAITFEDAVLQTK
jgi:hypothetical protein